MSLASFALQGTDICLNGLDCVLLALLSLHGLDCTADGSDHYVGRQKSGHKIMQGHPQSSRTCRPILCHDTGSACKVSQDEDEDQSSLIFVSSFHFYCQHSRRFREASFRVARQQYITELEQLLTQVYKTLDPYRGINQSSTLRLVNQAEPVPVKENCILLGPLVPL